MDNTSNYNGTPSSAGRNELDLNQIGGAFVFNNTDPDADWGKLTLAFNYDLVRNMDDEQFSSGQNSQGIDNYFLNFANGLPLGNILLQDGEFIEDAYLDIGSQQGFGAQQAFLGYYGGIIDPVDEMDDDNILYNRGAEYTNVNQDFLRTTTGFNSKFTVNAATEFKDRLYLGAGLNFHSVLYERLDRFTENGYAPESPIQRSTFDNLLRTEAPDSPSMWGPSPR